MNFTETYRLKFYCSKCWKNLNGIHQHEFIKDYSNLTRLQFSYSCECGANSFVIIGIDRNREFKEEDELCNHESHFISSMSRCEKCGDDRE